MPAAHRAPVPIARRVKTTAVIGAVVVSAAGLGLALTRGDEPVAGTAAPASARVGDRASRGVDRQPVPSSAPTTPAALTATATPSPAASAAVGAIVTPDNGAPLRTTAPVTAAAPVAPRPAPVPSSARSAPTPAPTKPAPASAKPSGSVRPASTVSASTVPAPTMPAPSTPAPSTPAPGVPPVSVPAPTVPAAPTPPTATDTPDPSIP